ncbi:hypothetical protein BX600DRAFT_545431 [Xylariales sp. PMI_506]|nr:hypothetical protein BX600DRAFT_545431 [Xylariales sp. PMI_506]
MGIGVSWQNIMAPSRLCGKVVTACLLLASLLSLLSLYWTQFVVVWVPVDKILVQPLSFIHHETPSAAGEVRIVVASTAAEDTTWLHRHLPEWRKSIYVVDDPDAALVVPRNKGHESMVYLTYIIDHYDDLPEISIFIHASRFAWHNDDPDYDAVPTLRNLRLPHLRTAGYVNLRCTWMVGCPAEIYPHLNEASAVDDLELMPTAKHVYKKAFSELLPGVPVPDVVGVSCCAQFGVTRETIRRRPREDYVRFRRWLLDTPLEDALSGRVFEFSWHIIFGMEAVHCPSMADCYCQVYGLCDLNCSEWECEGRYEFPYSTRLPPGWPLVDWYGQDRVYSGSLL